MTAPTAAEAAYIDTTHLYDDTPSVLTTSVVEDESGGDLIDITGKFQIVSVEHATVLDFSTYFDIEDGRGTLESELAAVNRFEASVEQFADRFRRTVQNAVQQRGA